MASTRISACGAGIDFCLAKLNGYSLKVKLEHSFSEYVHLLVLDTRVRSVVPQITLIQKACNTRFSNFAQEDVRLELTLHRHSIHP
jgi:hypothetical protein